MLVSVEARCMQAHLAYQELQRKPKRSRPGSPTIDRCQMACLRYSASVTIAPKTQPLAATTTGVVTAIGFEPKGAIRAAHG